MDEELLDIEGAARFLGVSTTSLRRWTNSGSLACVRVGGRRERRFRHADLVAFLEEQPALPNRTATTQPASDHVSVGGMNLPYGTHLCGLYSTDDGRVKLAVAFLAGAMVPGTVRYLLAQPAARRKILAQLAANRAEREREIAAGRLVVCEYAATARAQLEFWQRHFVAAISAGAHTLRVVGDLSGFTKGISREALAEYERSYNEILLRRFPVVSLCLYDVRRFSSLDVHSALRGHGDGFRYPVERWLA